MKTPHRTDRIQYAHTRKHISIVHLWLGEHEMGARIETTAVFAFHVNY